MESETPQEQAKADGVSEFRKQSRQVVGTSFLLVLVLLGAITLHFIKPPVTYVLFCLIFIVDFSFQTYLIWKYKEYWITEKFHLQGLKTRIVAMVYAFLALLCLALAIFILTR